MSLILSCPDCNVVWNSRTHNHMCGLRKEFMSILDTAKSLVHGDRQKDYGHPIDDFSRSAGMLSAYLGVEVTPNDIPNIMTIIKLSRLKSSPHHKDSKVDIAGYAETNDMVSTELEKIGLET